MNTIILNNLSFAKDKDSSVIEKSHNSNAFESLLRVGTTNHATTNKSTFEMISNVNEQKAFATHILSYVDVISARQGKDIRIEPASVNNLYGSLAKAESADASGAQIAQENSSPSLQQQEVRQATVAAKESKSQYLMPTLFRNLYEKIKISIFGVNEKKIFIRDYYTSNNYSPRNFKMLDETEQVSITKLFHNGVEK